MKELGLRGVMFRPNRHFGRTISDPAYEPIFALAEELGVAWASMKFEHAANNQNLYNNLLFGPMMATGGSSSTAESWDQMRQVGAAARMMFTGAAAARRPLPMPMWCWADLIRTISSAAR